MNQLYRLTPHQRLLHNPLFRLEIRRTRWGESAETLMRHNLRRPLILGGGLLLVWLYAASRDRYGRGEEVVIWAFVGSLLALLWIDFNSISAAIGSINGEVVAGRWDLLRLTPLTTRQIIAAKHGGAQVRAWRAAMLVIALRVVVILMATGTVIWETVIYGGWGSLRGSDLSSFVVTVISVALISGLYILEPLWRLRAITALGVAISARARHQTSSLLTAVGAILALWIVEGFILLAFMFGIAIGFVPMAMLEYSLIRMTVCSPLVFAAVFVAAVSGFYAVIQSWSLRRAERWLIG